MIKKILHIRGDKDYIHYKNNLLYKRVDVKHIDNNLSKNKVLKKEDNDPFFKLRRIFLLWDDCLNVNYFPFRQKLRDICITAIKKLNYFDTILYNDEEYLDFIINNKQNEFIIFSQDDDDIILPEIYNIDINPGLNIYLWGAIDFLKQINNIKFYNQQGKKVKSNHFCNFYKETNNIPLTGLCDHQFITKKINDKKVFPTYWDTYFNVYIRHPSSLTFLRTAILQNFYPGISSLEQEYFLKYHIKRAISLMSIIARKNENILPLKSIFDLYKQLL
tara:strand:- start:567 stop:1391 length:825 start_codon:yes stop_codon:yes gene_type:complete